MSPIEVGEPVMESVNSTYVHDPSRMCVEDVMNCAQLDLTKIIPPGSPTKGFYFSRRYIENDCKYVECNVTKCRIDNSQPRLKVACEYFWDLHLF